MSRHTTDAYAYLLGVKYILLLLLLVSSFAQADPLTIRIHGTRSHIDWVEGAIGYEYHNGQIKMLKPRTIPTERGELLSNYNLIFLIKGDYNSGVFTPLEAAIDWNEAERPQLRLSEEASSELFELSRRLMRRIDSARIAENSLGGIFNISREELHQLKFKMGRKNVTLQHFKVHTSQDAGYLVTRIEGHVSYVTHWYYAPLAEIFRPRLSLCSFDLLGFLQSIPSVRPY